MKTIIINDNNFTCAAETLKSGGVVGVPTETVYGLAADGFNTDAVKMIYQLKGRPGVKPLSLLVSDADMAASVCSVFPQAARKLAEAFWPGPLTIVLPSRDIVPPVVTAGGSTIGVRCPDHPATLELIRLAGIPLAAPSANISNMPSPKNADDVLKYFGGKIPYIIDGGVCALGAESTIVSLADDTDKPYKIIRQGILPENEIKYILGDTSCSS